MAPVTAASHVLVPALVGLDLADAHELAMTAGVVLVSADPDGMPTTGVVSAQDPMAGTQVDPADSVAVLVERRGRGGGVAEPPAPLNPTGTGAEPAPA